MKYASIGPIAIHLPEKVETCDDLRQEFPRWQMDLIRAKTGIYARHIAAEGECASDLGVKAAEKLFEQYGIDPSEIDFLILCTQSPDYALPTTACIMQDRLGLPISCGAFDFNLGCSGYVYGLAMADGLIRMGAARKVLFITAETYSKYIAPDDRSLRTIFGDGATATLVEASDEQSLTGYQFGTDGSGADMLIVQKNGMRPVEDAIPHRHRQRWKSDLYMDGPSLIKFTAETVPIMLEGILESTGTTRDDYDWFIFHQATLKLFENLMDVVRLDLDKVPILLERLGNTVSCTIPILIDKMRSDGQLKAGHRNMMLGFGVGLSWSGCAWKETWQG